MRASEGCTAISDAHARTVARVCGRVAYIEVSPGDAPAQLVARIDDGTGVIDAVFMGRRVIPGVEPGQRVEIEGCVLATDSVPRIHNPRYELTCAS